MTYRALEILAQQAGSIPGRKDIIWITQGVELSTSHAPFTNFRPRLKQLSTLLVQTNIAINPVYELAKGFGGLDALQELATASGGQLYQTGDVNKSIVAVMDFPRGCYWITYLPPAPDGRFHTIRVISSRKEIHILAQRGYDSYPSDASRDEALAAVLNNAVSSTFDASEIGLHAKLAFDSKPVPAVHVQVRVDSADVLLRPQGNGYVAQLGLTLASYSGAGRPTATTNSITVNLTQQQHKRAIQNGISVGQFVITDATVDRIRVIVLDRGSGGIGSLTILLPHRNPK